MQDFNQLMPLSQMERITRQYLCDNLDAVLDRVGKENIGLVITDDNGNDDLVLCPAHWITYSEELIHQLNELEQAIEKKEGAEKTQ